MGTSSTNQRNRWLEGFENGACFTDDALAECLAQLASLRATSIQMLSGPALPGLIEAAGLLSYRPATFEAGKPEARVYQEFDYCGAVPPDNPIVRLGEWFGSRVRRALKLMQAPPLKDDFFFNNVVCQRYRPGDLGITPHRDHASYTGLIVLVVLCGRGRYYACHNRQGADKQEIASSPGRAILMPGPGFGDRNDRPFHMVGAIGELRYSVGLRHDARKTGSTRPGKRTRSNYPQNL